MGAPVRRIGFVAALLAWAAFLLPWERCESTCHDRVLPQVGAHACHAGDARCHAGDDCSGADDDTGDHDARHSAVDFSTLRPDTGPGLVAFPAPAAAPGPPLASREAAAAHAERPSPVPRPATTVLLL